MEKKYDVFISCKSEDYQFADEVYRYLTSKGLSVFIAGEELRKIGEAHFASAIDDALDNSKHMIVVASSLKHIRSKWVKYEWSTFSNDLKSGYRDGNLLTILSDTIELRSLPASLRHQQSFHLNSYENTILDYLHIRSKKREKSHHQTNTESLEKTIAVFKFYSNENCQILLDGKKIGNIIGKSDEAFIFPVERKGDYRFKIVNAYTAEENVIKEHIDIEEERDVDIQWGVRKPFKPDQEWPTKPIIKGKEYLINLGVLKFNMIRVEGGLGRFGATKEQQNEADSNEFPSYVKDMHSFYISQFPITQNIWEFVMGYNKSEFREKEASLRQSLANIGLPPFGTAAVASALLSGGVGLLLGAGMALGAKIAYERARKQNQQKEVIISEKGHYPCENLTYDEAQEFVSRLSQMTGLQFSLPTEEEWEYAARGGNKSKGYKYSGSNNIDDVAWYRDNAEHSTHPVGEKMPNELGIFDMCGNVWEWTKTPAGPYGVEIKTTGDIFIRRGGSWWHEKQNCRISKRYASSRTKKTSGLGLRVVIRENIG